MVIKRLSQSQAEKLDKTLNDLKRTASVVRSSTKKFHHEVKRNIGKAIAAGFAFMIALVWRDAVSDAIDYTLAEAGITANTYLYKILAAVVVTLLAVIAIMYFSRWSEEPEKPKEEKK